MRRDSSGELTEVSAAAAKNQGSSASFRDRAEQSERLAEREGAGDFSLAEYMAGRRAAIAGGDITGGMGAPLSTLGGSDEGVNLTRSDDDPTSPPGLDIPKPNIIMERDLPTMQAINEKARRKAGKPAGTCSSCGGGKSTAKSALESLLSEESFAPRDSMPSTNEVSGDSLDSERSSLKGDLPTHGYYGFPILEPAQTLREAIGDPSDLGPRQPRPHQTPLQRFGPQ